MTNIGLVPSISLPNVVLKTILKPISNCFNGCLYNVQSLIKNMDEIRFILSQTCLDFLCFTETWLSDEFTDQAICIDGYKLIRKDRDSNVRYGGLCVYLKKHLKFKILNLPASVKLKLTSDLEYLLCEIYLNSHKILLGVLYNPPISKKRSYSKVKRSIKDLDILLSFFSVSYDEIIFVGDLNFNILDNKSNLISEYKTLLSSLGLKIQNNVLATHFTSSNSTLIDHLITKDDCPLKQCNQVSLGLGSHHDLIFFSFDYSIPPQDKYFYYRDFKNIDQNKLLTIYESLPWSNIYNATSSSTQLEIFNHNVDFLFRKCVNLKRVKIKQKEPPWMNDAIKTEITNRNDYYSTWKLCKSEINRKKYTDSRNRVTKLIRSSKSEFLKTKLDTNLPPKIFWKNIRNLGVGKCKNLNIPGFSGDDLNQQFYSNFSKNLKFAPIDDFYSCNNDDFSFKNITEGELVLAISNVKSNTIGLDNINFVFIKLILPLISDHLLHIFNYILTSSSFPDPWKIAKIIPIPKIKNPVSLVDFRPISILPTLSKAFENILKQQINDHLLKNNLHCQFQSGYRPFHSTTTALLKICDDIRLNMNQNKLTFLTLLDFSKAFDTINHSILCSKLKNQFKFSSSAVKLIQSYLTGRKQLVSVNGTFSTKLPVLSGVPQGSVVGPLLFCLYITDIQEQIINCNFHLYADDLQLYNACNKNSHSACVKLVNEDLDRISAWATLNSLKLNVSKSQAIVIYKSFVDDSNFDKLLLNGGVISYSSTVRNLGIIFNKTLTWDEQVISISKKVFYCLRSLWSTTLILEHKIKKLIFLSFIFPIFLYGDTIMYGMSAKNKNILQKCFNACIRYMFNLRKFDHVSPYADQVLDCSLLTYYRFRVCHFIYNLIKTKMPGYLFSKLILSKNFNTNLRLNIINNKCRALGESMFVGGIKEWNKLPLQIKFSKNRMAFLDAFILWNSTQQYV